LKQLTKRIINNKLKSLDLKVSGKIVKVFKNGEQQAWGTRVEIRTNDAEAARNIAEAFKSAISLCEE